MKYGAVRTTCAQEHTHASRIEARRCDDLSRKEATGEITHLRQQPAFAIEIGGRKICKVILDFEYRMAGSGLQIDEDVKGKDNPMSKLKRKMVEAAYPGIVVTLWPPVKVKTRERKVAP